MSTQEGVVALLHSACRTSTGGSALTINMSNNTQTLKKYKTFWPRTCLISVSVCVIGTLVYARWFQALVFAIWGTTLFSSRWCISLHGQSIAEHYREYRDGEKEPREETPPTSSTYYWLENALGFNTGYHDEHHTFPNIAWYHLPKLHALAPEVFTNGQPRRYLGLWFDWAFSGFDSGKFRICHKM